MGVFWALLNFEQEHAIFVQICIKNKNKEHWMLILCMFLTFVKMLKLKKAKNFKTTTQLYWSIKRYRLYTKKRDRISGEANWCQMM